MRLRLSTKFARLLMVLFGVIAPFFAARAIAQNVGKVGAVNPEATATPQGGTSRTLTIGTDVVYRERIQTSAQGSTQILFPDTSVLNVARNSSVVIDEYFYDSKSATGSMLTTISKGALRFVGGQISHGATVKVNTPVATLGIRGGIATAVYPVPPALAASDPSMANTTGALVIAHFGIVTLRNNTGEVTIRPGFACWVNGPDGTISAPFRIADAALALIVAELSSSAGERGGATTPPAAPFLSLNRIGSSIPWDPTRPPGSDPLGGVSIIGAGNGLASSRSQANQVNRVNQTPQNNQPASQTTTPSTGAGSQAPPPYL